jgi:fatty acid synthase
MQVGDPEELAALDKVFCKGRQTPLLIYSVKSNMGHSEPAFGMCSITKVLMAMEHGLIPPNLHFYSPRQDVEGLLAGL